MLEPLWRGILELWVVAQEGDWGELLVLAVSELLGGVGTEEWRKDKPGEIYCTQGEAGLGLLTLDSKPHSQVFALCG